MADIFTEALKKLDKELGGNKIGKALDEAAGAPQPKKEEPKAAAPKPTVPAKPVDPLAGLSNEQLKKKLAELDAQLKQTEAAKTAVVPTQNLERTPVNRITKVDDFDIDEYITSLLKEQASAGQ